jgi:hypothetical protein
MMRNMTTRRLVIVTQAGLTALILLLVVVARLPASAESSAVTAASPRWRNPELLSTALQYGGYGAELRVAPNGNMMLIYGQAMDSMNNQINPYYRILPANSFSWGAPARVHTSAGILYQTTFEFDNSGVPQAHAVWRTGNAVFYARQSQWAANGSSLIFNNAPRLIFDPAIAIGSDNVIHIFWTQEELTGQDNLYHAYSTNNGVSWTYSPALATNTRKSAVPSAAVDQNGHVHVIWEERTGYDPVKQDFNYEVRYKKATKTGSSYTWNANPTTISGALTTARRPVMLAEGNTLHVAFTNLVSDTEQYAFYVRLPAGSTNWTAPTDITQGNPLSVNTNAPFYLLSSLVICRGNLNIFYHGNPAPDTNEQVFGQERKDNVWHSRETVTDGSARTVRPSVACRDNALHVAYERVVVANTNHQIYHMFAHNLVMLPILRKN